MVVYSTSTGTRFGGLWTFRLHGLVPDPVVTDRAAVNGTAELI
jgi:hypothetical protein